MTRHPIGRSLSRWPDFSPESLAENLRAGVSCMEFTFNDVRDTSVSLAEIRTRVLHALHQIRAAGMEVWSVHLPYSPLLDVSTADRTSRRETVALLSDMISIAAEFTPRRMVLHPSSEPIPAEERDMRIGHSSESIGLLAEAARSAGATLCVENLPRTGLGQTAAEILRLIEGHAGVRVCFDVNHMVHQTHTEFIQTLGPGRIATVHFSDYEFEDERHWLPGKGSIDWGALWHELLRAEYDGPLMMECHGSAEQIAAAGRHILECEEKKIAGESNDR